MTRLQNRVALEFGAGSVGPGWGNGKASAVAYARAGAIVLAIDVIAAAAVETVDIITGEGGRASAHTCDVTKEASSMVLTDGLLYAMNHSGDTFVLRASRKFELLAINSLGEHTEGSIAVSNGDLFLRTHRALWCIGTKL